MQYKEIRKKKKDLQCVFTLVDLLKKITSDIQSFD